MTRQRSGSSGGVPLAAGLLASVLSVVCCIGPLILVSVGLGGAWATRLAALDPYRPWLVTLSLLFLSWGIWSTWKKPFHSCGIGTQCRTPVAKARWMVWGIVLLSFLILAFPWYGPLFLH